MTLRDYMKYLDSHPPVEVQGEQYCLQLYSLARFNRTKSALEIGLGWGHSAHAIAAAMGASGGGLLTSVDLSDDLPAEDQFMLDCGVQWNRVIANAKSYQHDGMVDLLYIDEDAAATYSNFHRFRDNVRPGGLIIMDGIGNRPFDKTPAATNDVGSLITEGFNVVTLPYSDEYCHAVCRRPA